MTSRAVPSPLLQLVRIAIVFARRSRSAQQGRYHRLDRPIEHHLHRETTLAVEPARMSSTRAGYGTRPRMRLFQAASP